MSIPRKKLLAVRVPFILEPESGLGLMLLSDLLDGMGAVLAGVASAVGVTGPATIPTFSSGDE